MSTLDVLSVGYVYDYPLLGGEKFYDYITTFNDKYGLQLTEDNFDNVIASRKSDGLVAFIAVSTFDAKIFQFVNQSSKGIVIPEDISFQEEEANVVRCKPVKFVQEMAFLKDIPLNTTIHHDLTNSDIVSLLVTLLTNYSKKSFNAIGNNGISGFIIRYYGSGEETPQEYGSYPDSDTVCIVDIPNTSSYTSYCIRTEKDYVESFRH